MDICLRFKLLNSFREFLFLGRVELLKVRDGFVMILLERIELLPRTREFLIGKMQFASLLYRIKHSSNCNCCHCYEQRPHDLRRHSETHNF